MATTWKAFWHGPLIDGERIEVFVAPDGHSYKRCLEEETPDLEVPAKYGLPPHRLKCIDHWRPQEEVPTP